MSYQVLSLKWRPLAFDQIIGQTHITQTLLNAISMDRLAQAFLFSGPRGVGKTTTAIIIAKSLNCTSIDENTEEFEESCGECENCISISESRRLAVSLLISYGILYPKQPF